jgi:hypothetical protein
MSYLVRERAAGEAVSRGPEMGRQIGVVRELATS